jgi:hypothetical protein
MRGLMSFSEMIHRMRDGELSAIQHFERNYMPFIRLCMRLLRERRFRSSSTNWDAFSRHVAALFHLRFRLGLFDIDTPRELQLTLVQISTEMMQSIVVRDRGGESTNAWNLLARHEPAERFAATLKASIQRLTLEDQELIRRRVAGASWTELGELRRETPAEVRLRLEAIAAEIQNDIEFSTPTSRDSNNHIC